MAVSGSRALRVLAGACCMCGLAAQTSAPTEYPCQEEQICVRYADAQEIASTLQSETFGTADNAATSPIGDLRAEITAGNPRMFGTFRSGSFERPSVEGFGVDSGAILSTGDVSELNNFNRPGYGWKPSTDFSPPGREGDTATLVLKFDVTAELFVSFTWVVASSELPQFGGSSYNDQFFMILNDVEIAKLSNGNSASINSLVPYGKAESSAWSDDYVNNTQSRFFTFSGYTKPLIANGPTKIGENVLNITVTERGDGVLDTAVFIRGQTLRVTEEYYLRPTEWGRCSPSCGPGGVHTRTVECVTVEGKPADAVRCAGMLSPPLRETCLANPDCIFKYGEWSECSATCGTATQTRTATCIDPAEQEQDESKCSGAITFKPCDDFKPCPLTPAPSEATAEPSTATPTAAPTAAPTGVPSVPPTVQTAQPTSQPTRAPTGAPSAPKPGGRGYITLDTSAEALNDAPTKLQQMKVDLSSFVSIAPELIDLRILSGSVVVDTRFPGGPTDGEQMMKKLVDDYKAGSLTYLAGYRVLDVSLELATECHDGWVTGWAVEIGATEIGKPSTRIPSCRGVSCRMYSFSFQQVQHTQMTCSLSSCPTDPDPAALVERPFLDRLVNTTMQCCSTPKCNLPPLPTSARVGIAQPSNDEGLPTEFWFVLGTCIYGVLVSIGVCMWGSKRNLFSVPPSPVTNTVPELVTSENKKR